MNSFSYIIQVILISMVFVGFYVFALEGRTHFKQNRLFLLLSCASALFIPFLQLPQIDLGLVRNFNYTLNEVVVTGSAKSQALLSRHEVFIYLYVVVALILLFRMILGLIQILSIRKQARQVFYKDITICVSKRDINPFSVFGRIYVNEALLQDRDALDRVVLHESTHVGQKHGIDIFVTEILCILFWINPFFWWIKKELRMTHEYLADEKVLEQDFDLVEYFKLIFDNAVGETVGFANNFNQSLNIKRMKMMKKKRSSRFSQMISLASMPLLFTAVLLLSSQVSNGEITNSKVVVNAEVAITRTLDRVVAPLQDLTDQVEKKSEKKVEKKVEKKIDEKQVVFTLPEKMPEFPGGNKALIKYLRENTKYPEKAKEEGIQGRVYVQCVISKDGKVTDVEILKGVHPLLDAEALRVIKAMPKWKSGTQKGDPVNVNYRLPINFSLK